MTRPAAALTMITACSWSAWLAVGGCASSPTPAPKDAPRVVVADGGALITAAELDELTRAFADRYVGLLYSACATVKESNPDPLQRREAQVLLLDCSTNIYDIASNADSFTRLLDLVVVTRLLSQVWVDDGRAARVFGPRAGPVADAMHHARTEAQALAARVLTAEQLGVLETLLVDWRRDNPEMVRASFVRFSNFAIGRGRSAASEVLAARGYFAQVGEAGQAVDEARLLAERMFYLLKRQPTLLRWQAVAAKDDLLATPEVAAAMADLHRLADVAERLPAHAAAERQAILAAVDARMAGADATLANVRGAIAEASSLVASLEPAGRSLDQVLRSADTLLARYDAWDRWSTTTQARPFDVREYTEIVKQSGSAAQRWEAMLTSSGNLLASPDWHARIDEWNRSADGRIQLAAAESRRLLDGVFRRLYLALGALVAVLICFRVVSRFIGRRPAA